MGTTYGYARVSTQRQKLERQITNIKAAHPDATIVTEKYTGTSIERPAFTKLLKKVKSGDLIIFDSVSRMSRTADEGYELYMSLYKRGVDLVFLKEPMINTDVFRKTLQVALTGTDADAILEGVNRYLMILAEKQIHIAFDQAEKEVDDLHGRISEGLRQAKLNGSQVGREAGRKYETQKSKDTKDKILKLSKDFEGNMKDVEVLEILKISRNSYYKYKRELLAAL